MTRPNDRLNLMTALIMAVAPFAGVGQVEASTWAIVREHTPPAPLSSIPPVRVAVVDIGTNSTRLFIADVDPRAGFVQEIERRSNVTRLGHGVDSSGSLAADAIERVFRTLAEYRAAIDQHGASANLAVLTSAVRDASNGADFAER